MKKFFLALFTFLEENNRLRKKITSVGKIEGKGKMDQAEDKNNSGCCQQTFETPFLLNI